VDCIEINSTFYRPPFARTTASWLRRTAHRPDFFFTAKLHKSFTHEGKIDAETVNTHEGKIDAETVKQFHRGFGPFLEAGKLKHLLVQFRYDFADQPQSRQHLASIVGNFDDAFSLVVELRHKSWEEPEALEFLGDLGVTVCNLDYPTSSRSFSLQHCTVGRDGYFRMHGRNAEKWFRQGLRVADRDCQQPLSWGRAGQRPGAQGPDDRTKAARSERTFAGLSEAGKDCCR